ncbi:unnamed protein product, partial [Rangifer tarandus platyrhynchus]
TQTLCGRGPRPRGPLYGEVGVRSSTAAEEQAKAPSETAQKTACNMHTACTHPAMVIWQCTETGGPDHGSTRSHRLNACSSTRVVRAEIASPMLDCVLDHGDAVVIDNGSHSFKVGYCGEDLPRSVVPALKVTIQRRRDSEDDGPAEDRPQVTTEVLLGKDAWKAHDPERIVTTPIKHGMIVDKEALEELWEPILENHAQTDANNLTMLATYPPLTPPVTLEWMVEVLFEKFHCQRLALMPPGPLSLFSTGRSRGLVVEIGESITSATPVFEGFPLAYSTFRMFRAGGAVSTALSQILRQTPSLHGSLYFSNAEVKEEMKHKLCSVAVPDLHTQLRSADTSTFEDRAFQLPDGSVIEVNQRLRYEPAEVLFDSTILAEDLSSVPDVPRLLQSELRSRETLQGLVYAAISATDTEFQTDMKQNVVLAGGSSLLRGLSDRLLGELFVFRTGGFESLQYNCR